MSAIVCGLDARAEDSAARKRRVKILIEMGTSGSVSLSHALVSVGVF